MNLWSDIMVELLENVKNNPIAYYVGLLIGLALLALVITLIVKNEKKKKGKFEEEKAEKARIEKHVDLESMIAKMQEQEQSKLKDADPVANFEQEQEEKAIISYQELVNAVKTDKKEPINVTNVSSTGDVLSTTTISPRDVVADDKPIFIDEVKLPKNDIEFDPQEEVIVEPKPKDNNLENMIEIDKNVSKTEDSVIKSFDSIFTTPVQNIEKEVVPELTKEESVKSIVDLPEKKEVKNQARFKNSEFISPIYGRQNSNISYPKISSFKYEEDDSVINISSDVDPNTEFLKTLRDYRDN